MHLRVGEVGDEPWLSALQCAQDLHASGHLFGTSDENEVSEETQDDVCHILGDEDDADEASTCSFFCCRGRGWSTV